MINQEFDWDYLKELHDEGQSLSEVPDHIYYMGSGHTPPQTCILTALAGRVKSLEQRIANLEFQGSKSVEDEVRESSSKKQPMTLAGLLKELEPYQRDLYICFDIPNSFLTEIRHQTKGKLTLGYKTFNPFSNFFEAASPALKNDSVCYTVGDLISVVETAFSQLVDPKSIENPTYVSNGIEFNPQTAIVGIKRSKNTVFLKTEFVED